MENASKALIIAGAILLAILIIGLGMFIYNQAAGTMNEANLNSEQARSYNEEFLQYQGTKSGTQVRTLIQNIQGHNRANTDDFSLQIQITNDEYEATDTVAALTAAATYDDIINNINAGNTYTVSFAYDPNSGYITSCGIVQK